MVHRIRFDGTGKDNFQMRVLNLTVVGRTRSDIMQNIVSLTVVALTGFYPAFSSSAANVSDFINYSVDSNNNVQLPGRLHVPADYAANPDIERPLILFLHGGGESGTNNLAQINGNVDNLLAAAKQRGAFLYAPQTNSGWGDGPSIPNAMTMIDRAIADFNVDTNRVYVTGLSLGGGGVWNVLNQFAERVAASVPICCVATAELHARQSSG
jgi:predicted peptidase